MSVDIWNCHPWPLDDSRCRCKIHLVSFLYIFLLLDCFKWALIHRIEKWRVHSELCQFQRGGISYDSPVVISLYLPISWLFQMSSHWLHWKAKSSLWALPVSNLWGGISYDSPGVISLYIPISRLFQMSSHWLHWKVKSSLWALPVSNWGGGGWWVYHMIHLVSFLYIFLLVDCFKCQRVHSVLWQF